MNRFKQKPERLAWFILLTSFTTFCLLSVFVPLSIYGYAVSATQPLPVELTSVRGIVLMGSATSAPSTSVTDGNTVTFSENTAATTDETSQAIITFADDSSLTLYGDTSIILHASRQPRFSLSSKPSQILVELTKGRLRATAARNPDVLDFEITTPHATAQLSQGSFSIEVNAEDTQVTTRFGEATVTSGSNTITLNQGQRTVAGANAPLSPALSAAKNLLQNSNFEAANRAAWEPYTITPIENVTATTSIITYQNRPVLSLRSQGADNIHSEVGAVQQVNKDVRDYQSLRVFAEVRLVEQSLPGGGQLGSEFPIMLHIAYKDASGNDRDWFHGFYYRPSPENYILYNQPDNSNERIARYLWYPYESVNLLTTLGPAKPIYIKSIRIYASGWIYDSMVANISLLAEE